MRIFEGQDGNASGSTSSGTQKYQQWYSKVPALELESTSTEMEVVRRARLSREAEMVARSVGRLRWWRGQSGGLCAGRHMESWGIVGFCGKILRKISNLTHNLTQWNAVYIRL